MARICQSCVVQLYDDLAKAGTVKAPPNKRMKLTSALASAPRDTEEGHFACPPFGRHRALAAYPRCSADLFGAGRR